jgi:hypothetical protein
LRLTPGPPGRCSAAVRRTRLSPAFVTTVLTSGCAWSYGAAVHYAQTAENPNALGATGRVAWGFGAGRNALVLAADLGVGSSVKYGGVWFESHPRLEYAWLPRPRGVGLRLGAGGLVIGGTRGPDLGAGPAISGEVLYGLSGTEDEDRGYRATLLGFAVQTGYDVVGDSTGPMVVFAASITSDGVLPFGNPPRPRPQPAPVHNVIATEPAR